MSRAAEQIDGPPTVADLVRCGQAGAELVALIAAARDKGEGDLRLASIAALEQIETALTRAWTREVRR